MDMRFGYVHIQEIYITFSCTVKYTCACPESFQTVSWKRIWVTVHYAIAGVWQSESGGIEGKLQLKYMGQLSKNNVYEYQGSKPV